MLKNISIVFFSFIYVNIIGYIFHLYVSRKLTPTGYGEFMVLYSFMLSIGNLANIFSTVSTKCITEEVAEKFEVFRYLRKIGAFIGAIVTLSGFAFSPFLKSFLKVSKISYIWIITSCWIFMFLVAVERSFLQACERFDLYAISTSVELTVRLFLSILFLSAGFYIYGAILPSFLSLALIFLILICINKNILGRIKKIPIRKLLLISAFSSPSGFFIYLDNIFIRRIFSPNIAGYYASVSIIGKSLIWFSIAIFSVFFPRLILIKKNKKNFKKLSLKAVFFVFIVFLLAEILILSFGKPIFLFLFGKKYIKAFSLLPFYIFSILPLSVGLIFIGINTSVEKNLTLIYLHLFSYLIGFMLFDFESILEYIFYIFILNLCFCLLYLHRFILL